MCGAAEESSARWSGRRLLQVRFLHKSYVSPYLQALVSQCGKTRENKMHEISADGIQLRARMRKNIYREKNKTQAEKHVSCRRNHTFPS